MFFIPNNTPSSKNSKQWTGKFLVNSKSVQEFKKSTVVKQAFMNQKSLFLEKTKYLPKPLNIGFTFIRDTNRKFDYINAAQIIQDMMVDYGWVEDDNNTELIPYFFTAYKNPNKAGCIISILDPKIMNELPDFIIA